MALVKGGMRPGLTMSTDTDTHTPSAYGQVHTLAYTITAAAAPTSLHFLMIVVEKPGGGFQATLQRHGTRARPYEGRGVSGCRGSVTAAVATTASPRRMADVSG